MGSRPAFRAFLDTFLETLDLFRFQPVQLAGDAGKAKLLANIDENLAFKVQFFGQGEHPDFLVFV
jgi:hypothetical protein